MKERQSKKAKITQIFTSDKEISVQARKLVLALAVILRVTITFILAILADYFIIIVITWTFGSVVNRISFAAYLLEGIQLLSALGTALAYILFLIRSLFRELQETKETIRENEEKSR